MDGKLQNKSGHEPGFLAGLKKSRHAHTLVFMHTHKNAHAPQTSSLAKAYTHRPIGTHMRIHVHTYMFILNKLMHMLGGVVYVASDAVPPYIPCHSFSWLSFRACVTAYCAVAYAPALTL